MGDVPTVAAEAGRNIFAERPVCRPIQRDLICVVYPAKVWQLQVSGEGSRFATNTFHHVSVAAKGIDLVIKNLELRPVITRFQPLTGDRHAHAVADPLTQRPGGGLDSRGDTVLGMSRRFAVELAEALDVVE